MTTAALIAIALQAAQPVPGPPSVLDLLEGEWICRVEWLPGGPVWRTESWQRDSAGRLTGIIGSRGSGGQDGQEAELAISGQGRNIRMTYRPTGGAQVRYRLVRNDRHEAVFESTGNGSPRIITFRSGSFRRLEVMHGLANGSSRRWSYQPPGMHTPIIGCDGGR